MLAFLSEEWLARRQTLGSAFGPRPGATAVVQWNVVRGKKDEEHFVETTVDGSVTSVRAGDGDEVDYVLQVPLAAMVAIESGELALELAFMRGTIKLVGNMGRFMALLPLTRSDERLAAAATLHAETEY